MKYGSIAVVFVSLWYCPDTCKCDLQTGPDPWHYEKPVLPVNTDETDLPPDLRVPLKKDKRTESKYGYGEWWFKRLLAIMLKSGHVKKNDDDTIHVSLEMKFDKEQWEELDEYLKSEASLTDAIFRRAMSLIEEAIYKPTIADKIVMAWSDYIQVYITQYKTYITWMFGVLGAIGILMWLWKHASHKHIIVIVFAFLYVYEVIISYMEAEQKDYEKFISSVNACKWYFWTSDCTVPAPDLILFLKHMNPMKIAIRMFTSLISEPILAINATIKLTLQDITGGLCYPIDKMVYGLLIVVINISLIYLLIMTIFNFIFNIPFNFNFLGIIGINLKQNRKSFLPGSTNETSSQVGDTDRISGDRLDRLLNVCSLALTNAQNRQSRNRNFIQSDKAKLQRSASTGRLSALCSLKNTNDKHTVFADLRRRAPHEIGGGDH